MLIRTSFHFHKKWYGFSTKCVSVINKTHYWGLFDQIDRLTIAIISEKASSPFLLYQEAVSMLTSAFV